MTEEVKKKIEDQFVARCKASFVKFKSKKFYTEQADFFAGAMSALIASGIDTTLNPHWTIAIMRSEEIVNY